MLRELEATEHYRDEVMQSTSSGAAEAAELHYNVAARNELIKIIKDAGIVQHFDDDGDGDIDVAEILDELDVDGDGDIEVKEGWNALKELILRKRAEQKSAAVAEHLKHLP